MVHSTNNYQEYTMYSNCMQGMFSVQRKILKTF